MTDILYICAMSLSALVAIGAAFFIVHSLKL